MSLTSNLFKSTTVKGIFSVVDDTVNHVDASANFQRNVNIGGNLVANGLIVQGINFSSKANTTDVNSALATKLNISDYNINQIIQTGGTGNANTFNDSTIAGNITISNTLQSFPNSLTRGYFYDFSQPTDINIGIGTETTVFSFYGTHKTVANSTITLIIPYSASEIGGMGFISPPLITLYSNVNIGTTPATVYSFYVSATNAVINLACNIPISLNESGNMAPYNLYNTNSTLSSANIYVYKNGNLSQTITGTPNIAFGTNYSYLIRGNITPAYNYSQYILKLVNSFTINHITSGSNDFYEIRVGITFTRNQSPAISSTYSYVANTTTSTSSISTNVTLNNSTSPTWTTASFTPTIPNYTTTNTINSGIISLYKNGSFLSSNTITVNTTPFNYSVSSGLMDYNYNQYLGKIQTDVVVNHSSSPTPVFYEIKVSLNTTKPLSVNSSSFNYVMNTSTSTSTSSTNVSLLTTTPTGYINGVYNNVNNSGYIDSYLGTGSVIMNQLIGSSIFTQGMISQVKYITGTTFQLPLGFSTGGFTNTYLIKSGADVSISLSRMDNLFIGYIIYFRKINPTTSLHKVSFLAGGGCVIYDQTASVSSVSSLLNLTNTSYSIIYNGNGDWYFINRQ